MCTCTKRVFSTMKRPATRTEILRSRFLHAKASLAIEGLHLTHEEIVVFEACIQEECSTEERTRRLRDNFPSCDIALRA